MQFSFFMSRSSMVDFRCSIFLLASVTICLFGIRRRGARSAVTPTVLSALADSSVGADGVQRFGAQHKHSRYTKRSKKVVVVGDGGDGGGGGGVGGGVGVGVGVGCGCIVIAVVVVVDVVGIVCRCWSMQPKRPCWVRLSFGYTHFTPFPFFSLFSCFSTARCIAFSVAGWLAPGAANPAVE